MNWRRSAESIEKSIWWGKNRTEIFTALLQMWLEASFKEWKFIGSDCHYFYKRRHLTKVCLKSDRRQIWDQSTNKIEDREKQESSLDQIYKLGNSEREDRKKILLKRWIEGRPSDMKLDTGAAVNVMSITDFKRNAPKVEISKTSFFFLITLDK